MTRLYMVQVLAGSAAELWFTKDIKEFPWKILLKCIHSIALRRVKVDGWECWVVSDEGVMADSAITASLSKVLGQTDCGGLLKSSHIYQN